MTGATGVTNPYDRPRVLVGRPSAPGLVGLFGLWTLVGLLGSVSVLGMLTIGAFVLPFAMAAGAIALWLTLRGPARWPSVTGLGAALGVAIGWLGVVLGGSSSPSSGSCTTTTDGVTTCESGGVPYDPNAFHWASALPFLIIGALIALGAVLAFLLLSRRPFTTGAVRSP